MASKLAIISVDGHVKPPRDAYREYIDPDWREAFDDWLRTVDGTPDGFVHPNVDDDAQWDPVRRLEALESQGVVAEVLFSNGLPFDEPTVEHTPDPRLTRAANVAYNRWLIDFCSEAPGRLCGLAHVSFDDVEQAVADITWAKEQGLGGVQMPPLHPGAKYFFDPALDPIWAACGEVGFALSQHGGTGAPKYAPLSYASFMVLATEQAFFSGRSLWQMILGGVFERFPELRVAYVETEDWWIAPLIELLDRRETVGDDWTEFAETLKRIKPYSKLPSEYWAANCRVGLSPFTTKQLPLDAMAAAGAAGFAVIRSDNAMIGVDYPHPETVFPAMFKHVADLVDHPAVSEDFVHNLLYRNAADLYRFDLAALQADIDRVGFTLDAVPEAPAGAVQATSLLDVVPSFLDRVTASPRTHGES